MVVVYIEVHQGEIKKSALEAVSFGAQIAKQKGSKSVAIITESYAASAQLGNYGIDEVIYVKPSDVLDEQNTATLISDISKNLNANYIVLAQTSTGKSIAGRLAVKTKKALVSGVTGMGLDNGKLWFKKGVYSGKATAYYSSTDDAAVLAILPNSIPPIKISENIAQVSEQSFTVAKSKIHIIERNLVKGKIPLTEADVVVSAGRGMKDPGNWGMIEELADLIGATTACSRPVADIGWRPHHEHVGQTGIAIRPSLYIAIGISGAIQHLAGVNNSKRIIVINKDPEAPFFKAADYGICGDLFEIVPRLNEAIKKFKASN
ncbi:MAG: electron transfer flavoprotein subunit alpha/FixB family protein [Saprospiraceae bacterium]